MKKFNDWLALKITNVVGSMWCAYIFCILALISLPSAIASHNLITIVSWIAQTFLQLVLLSVILNSQNLQGDKTESIIKDTHDVVLQEFNIVKEELLLARQERDELTIIIKDLKDKDRNNKQGGE